MNRMRAAGEPYCRAIATFASKGTATKSRRYNSPPLIVNTSTSSFTCLGRNFFRNQRYDLNPNGISRESYNSFVSRSHIKEQRPEARRARRLETIALIIIVILILAITITRSWHHINWSTR